MTVFWETKELGEIAYLAGRIGWKGLTAKEYTTSGPLFTSVHSLNHGDYVDFGEAFHISQERYDESPEIMLEPNDILLCKDGAGIGKVGIVGRLPGPATINSSLLLIRAAEGVYPKFLYYEFCSPSFQKIVQERIDGATTPHLYQREIRQFPIPIPPLPEQKRIVAILDEAFAGIAAATANAEKNLANARELFESYLNSVFEVTQNAWLTTNLSDLTSKIGSGATPTGGEEAYKQEGISLIRSLNVYDRRFTSKKLAFIDDQQADRLSNVVVEEHDVLINITGASVARCCIAPKGHLPARVNQHVSIIRPIKNKITAAFLCYLLTSKPYKDKLLGIGVSGGSTRQAITKAQLQGLPVSIPPSIGKQNEIVAKLDRLVLETMKLEAVYQKKLLELAELRRAILQKVFSGELTALPEKALQEEAA